jgi:transposase
MMSEIILGIDVSKKTLDAALIFENRVLCKQFQNSCDGFKELAAWLAFLKITCVHACLEATGVYGEAIALFLHESGHRVSVVNPLRIKGYASANMQRNKTDRHGRAADHVVLPDAKAGCVAAAIRRSQTIAVIGAASRSVGGNASGGRKPSG